MPAALANIVMHDGNDVAIPGGVRSLDVSGTGVGPFLFAHWIIDGQAGVQRAEVTAANALKVDNSAVTQPVSLASVPSHAVTNAGTFAVQAAASLASAAVASGAFASGALASGSIASGAMVDLGVKADAKNSATDTTAVSLISAAKQISFELQAIQAIVTAGNIAHDASAAAANPSLIGGYANAAAPADVSADGDAVRAWRLRNGAAATVITAAGALIGGDATNGLDVDVKRAPQFTYETVAASATAQVLGPTGAAGDYISHVLVIPTTTSPGNVLLLDNATSITIFDGGATSVSNLVPFAIPLGMVSASGAWKLTTGANVKCIGIGTFT